MVGRRSQVQAYGTLPNQHFSYNHIRIYDIAWWYSLLVPQALWNGHTVYEYTKGRGLIPWPFILPIIFPTKLKYILIHIWLRNSHGSIGKKLHLLVRDER
jgi:hypothetical protein